MEHEAHNISSHRNTFKIIFYLDIECPLSLGTARTKFRKNHMIIQHRPLQDVDVLAVLVLGRPGNFRKLTSSNVLVPVLVLAVPSCGTLNVNAVAPS